MSEKNPWTNPTPLSNKDFKALLATPRPDWQRQGSGGVASAQHGQQQQQAKKESKPFKPPKPRPKPQQQEQADDDDGPKYRDRAKERREGLNQDYEDAEADLAARGIRTEALDGLSIADSKFLGGDMAHTHLVKGLDYALLQQERIKQQKQQLKQQDGASAGSAAAAMAAAAKPKEQVRFAGPQGRALHAALFNQPTAKQRAAAVREMFLPRRLAFVFDFEGSEGPGGQGAQELPTTLRRPQSDCPPPPDLLPASSDGVLLGRVARIAAYISANLMGKGGQRKPKKKEHADAIKALLAGTTPEAAAAAAAAAAGSDGGAAAPAQQQQQQQQPPAPRPADADDDIFGDAGTDYAPAVPAKAKGAAGEAAEKPQGRYFDTRDDMSDLPPPPPAAGGGDGQDVDMDIEEGELPGPPPPPPLAPGAPAAPHQQGAGGAAGGWPAVGGPSMSAAEEKWRVPRPKDLSAETKALLKSMGEEAYGEYFPEAAYDGGSDGEGEDGVKKKGAAAAAAGAAEGGAEGDGKGGGKGGKPGAMPEERRREQKLDGQLGRIKQLFEEKGFGNEAAFKKPEKLEVGMTPARKRPRI